MTASPRISPEADYAARERESDRRVQARHDRVSARVLAGETRTYPPVPTLSAVEREIERSCMRLDLTQTGADDCAECGRALNLNAGTGDPDADGYIAMGAVKSGDSLKVSHIHICAVCSQCPKRAAARLKRRRRAMTGNFIWTAEGS